MEPLGGKIFALKLKEITSLGRKTTEEGVEGGRKGDREKNCSVIAAMMEERRR